MYFAGRLRIALPGGETLDETRAALCRCGHSKDKPFCDNSHIGAGFTDAGMIVDSRLKRRATTRKCYRSRPLRTDRS